MGETACSPSCAGRPCGRQQCATVLLVQEVHHHRHQRLRRHHPPRRQRLLPTLTWQMSVMPATREPTETIIIQGPLAEDARRRRPETPPASPGTQADRSRPIARTTSGSTFTLGAKLTPLTLRLHSELFAETGRASSSRFFGRQGSVLISCSGETEPCDQTRLVSASSSLSTFTGFSFWIRASFL